MANQILEVRHGHLLLYPGSYDEYVWSLQKGYLAELASSVASADPSSGSRTSSQMQNENSKFNYKEERKKLETAIKKQQKELSDIEKKLVELAKKQAEMTEKLITLTGPQAQTLSRELHDISLEILSLEERMLVIMEEQDDAQKKLLELTSN